MAVYAPLLKISGLNMLINKYESIGDGDGGRGRLKEIVINVGKNYTIEKKIADATTSWYRKKKIRYTVNMLYILIISCSIMWPCVYSIVEAIRNKNVLYVTSNVFALLFVIQFILGLVYYRTNHFTKIMKRNTYYEKYILIGLVIGTIISVVLAIVGVVLLVTGVNLNVYTELYNKSGSVGKVLICIAIFLDKFYSYTIYLTNLIIFSSVFIVHSIDIKQYTSILHSYVENSEEGLTIESITKDYSELKTQYASSVIKLNNIFSSITLFGIIGAYFLTVNNETIFVGIFSYIDVVCFLIIESVYIYSISRVKLSVASIVSIINSPKFISRFLSRTELEEFTGDIIDSDIIDSDIIQQKNMTVIKETLAISKKMSAKSIDKKVGFIKDVSIRNMIKTHENAEGIDWIILNDKLGGGWENFTVFGFYVDDATIIKKTTAVIVGLIMILHLNNLIRF